MLEVVNLAAAYGPMTVLKEVNLRVSSGQMVTLVGANGAGKSTLINTLSGLVRAKSGRIAFDGAELTGRPSFARARAGLLQVPEGRQVLGTMSVEENLQAGVFARRDRRNGARHDINDVFQLFPLLKSRRNQMAGSLSGGEQQMLAIGRALMGWPKLLLLDEPSLGLSPAMSKTVFGALEALGRSGLTMLLVEQNARRALEIADYAFVLERGKITLQGDAKALLEDPRVIARYLGG